MAEPALSKVAAGAGGAAVSREGLALLGHKEPRSGDKSPFVLSLCRSVQQTAAFLAAG